MTSEEHLHTSEILAFRDRRLSGTERSTAAAHLLRCEECRDRLPKPTAEEFWNCLMGHDEKRLEATGIGSIWMSAKDWFSEAIFDRFALRNAVFASVLLLAVLGFSLLLLIGPEGSPINNKLVAVVGDPKPEDTIPPASFDDPHRREVPNPDTSSSTAKSHRSVPETTEGKSGRPISAHERKVVKQRVSRQVSETGSRKLAETRGNAPCGKQRFVVLEARLTDEGLLLTWEKVPGAAYNVYLSDLDERLAAHFETSDKTSYLVTAKLDPEIIYRLRLVASLENGERIVSESKNFTINDLKKGSRSFGSNVVRKKTAASVRCVEVKQ